MKLRRREKQQDRGGLVPYQKGGLSPLTELNRIRSEINRIFEDPFNFTLPSTTLFEGWEPSVDVYEDKDKITVKAELPGMKKEEIDVSLVGDTLTISGERKHEEEKREGETYRAERYFGRFQRSVPLSTAADPNKIEASYKDGVLTVTCPKSEAARPKQIEVKAS
jgi:HSP20 family protein